MIDKQGTLMNETKGRWLPTRYKESGCKKGEIKRLDLIFTY
jgi:hypothetical protein